MTKMIGKEFRKLVTSNKPLPVNVEIDGHLDLYSCISLTTLPKGLKVDGYLALYGCTSLTHLPEGLEVGGYLSLSGCTSLTHLPEGLEVGGSLDLANCTSLTHLPKGLKVGGSLDLNRCTSLISIHTATVDELVYADLEFVERIPKDKLLLYVNFKWAVDIIKQTYLKRLALGR